MTKQEAIAAMREGKKVRHRYFSDDEYIKIQDDMIVTEEGYTVLQTEFWYFRQDSHFDVDWEIVD